MDMTWEDHQAWELKWHLDHGNCANSYNEETKQYDYATRMGLDVYKTDTFGSIGWDFGDKTVLDVGGGPYSMLLKSKAKLRVVLDPCEYPNWVKVRYKECGIELIQKKAEEMEFTHGFDIILCYNVLQHTVNPAEICSRMRAYGEVIHFFDWCEIGRGPGHPHNLKENNLNMWLGGEGKVEPAKHGKYYSGIFKGDTWHD